MGRRNVNRAQSFDSSFSPFRLICIRPNHITPYQPCLEKANAKHWLGYGGIKSLKPLPISMYMRALFISGDWGEFTLEEKEKEKRKHSNYQSSPVLQF